MSDPSAFGFGQFVPGFDFLQSLSKTASQAQTTGAPGMASWVAPTLSVEDIDKRIQELKSVLFWLEQNTTALKATIQAMEVQKMTLTTLQSMNVSMADLAKAFTARPPNAETASASTAMPETAPPASPKPSLFTSKPASAPVSPELEQPQPSSAADADQEPKPQATSDTTADTAAAKPAVDPMQWWGALTQQFQHIAQKTMSDMQQQAQAAGMDMPATAQQAPTAKTTASKPSVAKPAARKRRPVKRP